MKKISVIIPMEVFNSIMEELEDLEVVKFYDEAKNDDNSDCILFSDYLKDMKMKYA